MDSKKNILSQDQIVNFMKNYGFVFSNSEIYGGLANAWDYGPLGTSLKNNIKKLWWNEFVTKNPHGVGLDSSILNNSQVWKASGHLSNFSDPLIDCKGCHNRFRADKLIEESVKGVKVNEQTSFSELEKIINDKHIVCPFCGKFNWTPIRKFNLMFKTHQGVLEDDTSAIYLRPETAQGIFINYLNIQRSLRLKLPFSVGQIGKSFRNEITPGNFIFRTREFEQMELECFVNPKDADKVFDKELIKIKSFLFDVIKLNKANIKFHEHDSKELAHYSVRTIDVEFNFPHGWSELWGIANRTDFDLKSHIKHSNANLWYLDPVSNEKVIPYVIEPSVGIERLLYAIILDKYEVQQLEKDDTREILHLPYALAPYKTAILPLTNKLTDEAEKIYQLLVNAGIDVVYDASGSIGKRYRRQDAIGTPYCITYDFDSVESKEVTIRDRESMKQEKVKISKLIEFFASK
ncbi:MAG: glycine--tRNA ligase [Mycoplasmataceae bacterium]|nr:glycine--tRNA ligase [Mycoplasmataceae bacterium]